MLAALRLTPTFDFARLAHILPLCALRNYATKEMVLEKRKLTCFAYALPAVVSLSFYSCASLKRRGGETTKHTPERHFYKKNVAPFSIVVLTCERIYEFS